MTWDLNVSRGELRASAGAADALVTDLQPSLKKALDDLEAASVSFRNWTVGARMAETSEGWGAALGTLRDHLSHNAEGLRLLAADNDVLEQEVRSRFKGW